MRILALCGSLRQASSNRAILEALGQLVPPGITWEISDLIGRLPHFNPDLEERGEWDATVEAFRAQVRVCDALVISCPEYVHALPGSFKNALDWLVSEPSFPDKPVAVVHVERGSTFARDGLVEVLRTMSAELVPAASPSLRLGSNRVDAAGILARPELRAPLERALTELVAFLHSRSSE